MYILIFGEDRFHAFPYIVCQKTTQVFSHIAPLRFVVRDFKPLSAVVPGPSFSKAGNKHAFPQGRIAMDPKPCSWRKLRLPSLAHFRCPQYPLAPSVSAGDLKNQRVERAIRHRVCSSFSEELPGHFLTVLPAEPRWQHKSDASRVPLYNDMQTLSLFHNVLHSKNMWRRIYQSQLLLGCWEIS